MVLSPIDLISRLNRRIVVPSVTRTWFLREDPNALVDMYAWGREAFPGRPCTGSTLASG